MPSRAITPLHFSRFEFKYVLDRALRDEVEAELQHFVELDPFVQNQPDHLYVVRSLYFDDPGLSAFHDKMDGMLSRAKFRVRTYGRSLANPTPWFLEIKGRHNNLVFKHRTPLAGDFDRRARGDALSRLLLAHAEPGAVRDQFEFALYRRRIEPIVLVDYLRRPYLSRFDPEFRLTFDAELAAAATDTLFPGETVRTRSMLRGYTVMEVKFRRHVPAWFHHILQAYELRRTSISKICSGTEALGLQLDPN
ncbi:MAG TPA: polyphosphate polymerase domain-containing protein [Planctomycetota bacterium]|nr:polyphosphate polymerase domain-containing protein [Planctomycetota bacterium]